MWWLVAALIVFIAYRVLVSFRGGVEPSPTGEPAPLQSQEFTPLTLAKYNGVADPHVLLAVRGRVYDVTAGKAHYGPGGAYENFAGRDASRGLAKHSFESDMLTPLEAPMDTLEDLTAEERQSLNQWAEFFAGKYPFVGPLKNA